MKDERTESGLRKYDQIMQTTLSDPDDLSEGLTGMVTPDFAR